MSSGEGGGRGPPRADGLARAPRRHVPPPSPAGAACRWVMPSPCVDCVGLGGSLVGSWVGRAPVLRAQEEEDRLRCQALTRALVTGEAVSLLLLRLVQSAYSLAHRNLRMPGRGQKTPQINKPPHRRHFLCLNLARKSQEPCGPRALGETAGSRGPGGSLVLQRSRRTGPCPAAHGCS